MTSFTSHPRSTARRICLVVFVVALVSASLRLPFLFKSESSPCGDCQYIVHHSWGIRDWSLLRPNDPRNPSIKVVYEKPDSITFPFVFFGLPLPKDAQAKASWSYFDRNFDGIWDLRMAPSHPIAYFELLDPGSCQWEEATDEQFSEIDNFIHFAISGDRSDYEAFYEKRNLVEALRLSASSSTKKYCSDLFSEAADKIESTASMSLVELEFLHQRIVDTFPECKGDSDKIEYNMSQSRNAL